MYSLIGLKDPSIRQVFEVKLQSEKPATPGDVLKSHKEILRSRVRAELASRSTKHRQIELEIRPPSVELYTYSTMTCLSLTCNDEHER